MMLSTNMGGSKEWRNSPDQIFRHFQVLSNELSVPRVLLCPSDVKNRQESTNFQMDFESKGNVAISYFIGADADEVEPSMMLTGDRHITDGRFGVPTVHSRIVNFGTNHSAAFGAAWSSQFGNKTHGNVAMGEGRVSQLKSVQLREVLRISSDLTNQLMIP